MDSYDQLDEGWKESGRFLQLMILDGCFMIEIFRNINPKFSDEYAYNDPIFSKHAMFCKLHRIKRDMLMIENQLPLLLLKTLVAFETGSPQDDESINELVLKFFNPHQSTSKMGHRRHVLDVIRQSMLRERIHHRLTSTTMLHERIRQDTSTQQSMYPRIVNRSIRRITSMGQSMCQKIFKPCRSPTPREQGKQGVIWPATQLHEAGIRFKTSKTQYLNDINFQKSFLCFPSTISLPEIEVDDATESKFLNIMAFEQLHADAGSEVSSYVSFMDNIIDSERDVILLNENKIIKNFVGTEKNVADLFNGLAFDVSIDPGCRIGEVGDVHREVIAYCNNYCLRFHQSLDELWKTYFRSPWSCISLLAAIFLLCLTAIQTVYGVLAFYHQ
ncbi:UPF0481 protein At3g47200-like [Magnolia sinica]|uniref:UPF0481 protein At3g47200-like n=1 Tax=Magnolia sinica TaxID=86752 RepID=UPI0026582417|nr:UPF0481 protein At3g47200-like [Magnolia sinica]